eukprot:Opistho-2@21176
MTQHERRRKDHRRRIGNVLSLDVCGGVACARLKNGKLVANVDARNDARATNKPRADIADNVAIQVGHDHHIELIGIGHELHAAVVDNHRLELDHGIKCRHLLARVKEETVSKLHDVCLVDRSDLLPVIASGVIKRILCNANRVFAGDDLERLNDAGNRLMLETAVLSLGVLTNNNEIDVVVASGISRNAPALDDISKEIKFLAKDHVKALVAAAANRSGNDAFESDFVTPNGENALLERIAVRRNISLVHFNTLKLNRHICMLEDCLHNRRELRTNTISRNKGDGVPATVLRGPAQCHRVRSR